MMRMVQALVIATLMAASTAAQAASGGITYDCDTASGHYSELVLPTPGGSFTVEGKVGLQQIAPIGKYSPLTRLAITSAPSAPGRAGQDIAGFVLTALPESALSKGAGKGLVQFLNWDDHRGGTEQSHKLFGLTPAPKELDFRLSYDGRSVTVRIGGEEQSLPFTAAEPVVRIVCSTGEFLYTDLKIVPQG
jgi:hypothetical protein